MKSIKWLTGKVLIEYLEKRIFHMFRILESKTSDNRVNFNSQTYATLYSPQVNESERVNHSLLATIRASTCLYRDVFIETKHDHPWEYLGSLTELALHNANLEVCLQNKLAILMADVKNRILEVGEALGNDCNLQSQAREFQVRNIVYQRLFNLNRAA